MAAVCCSVFMSLWSEVFYVVMVRRDKTIIASGYGYVNMKIL